MGCPRWEEFGELIPDDASGFPLHAKPVPTLSFEKLRELEGGTIWNLEDWLDWMIDPKHYESGQKTTVGRCKFTEAMHQELIDKGFTELAPKGTVPCGGCNIFTVTEWLKKRLRVITHSYDINAVAVPHLNLSGVPDVKQSVHEGTYTLCLDMASWFSQFLLEPDVRNWLCYHHKGKLYRWRRLPMGQRNACHIAEATIKTLAHRASEVAHTITYIDNVKFSGSKEHCTKAARLFVEDANAVGATINEIPLGLAGEDLTAALGKLVKPTEDFIGITVNHKDKTVEVAKKTKVKLETIWKKREHWTVHHFLAFTSLLLYCDYVTGHRPHHWFDALRQSRDISYRIAMIEIEGKSSKTDLQKYFAERCHMSTTVRGQLDSWVSQIINRPPTPCPVNEELEFDGIVFSDAMHCRYSALGVTRDGWEEWEVGELSGDQFKASTASEPIGCAEATIRLFKKKCSQIPKRVLIVTDHSPWVGAVNRGWAKGYFLNAAIGRLSVALPDVQFRSIHMSGKLHVNDDTSRGAETVTWKLHLAKKLCEAVFRGLTTMNPYRQSVKVFKASVLNLSVEDDESPEDAALRINNALDAFLCL